MGDQTSLCAVRLAWRGGPCLSLHHAHRHSTLHEPLWSIRRAGGRRAAWHCPVMVTASTLARARRAVGCTNRAPVPWFCLPVEPAGKQTVGTLSLTGSETSSLIRITRRRLQPSLGLGRSQPRHSRTTSGLAPGAAPLTTGQRAEQNTPLCRHQPWSPEREGLDDTDAASCQALGSHSS